MNGCKFGCINQNELTSPNSGVIVIGRKLIVELLLFSLNVVIDEKLIVIAQYCREVLQ